MQRPSPPITLGPPPDTTRSGGPPAPPRRDDLANPLGRLLRGLPLDRRAGIQQQLSDGGEVPSLPTLARSLRGPDERLPLELPIAHVHGRAVREENPDRVRPPLHRRRMQRRLANPRVGTVRV